MIYQQINNGESGSTVRAKLNAMLSALITGAEGNNELWKAIRTIKDSIKDLSDEELSKKYTEIIKQSNEYTDTKVEGLYSYLSAASGLVDVATTLDYKSKFSKEQGGLVLTSLYGHFPNLNLTIPQPTGPSLFILYKAAGSEEWRYSTVSLGVSFVSKWGNSTNTGLTQKFLTENTLHKEAVVEGFSESDKEVLSAAFSTKVSAIINVDALAPLSLGMYASNTARKAVPSEVRKQGLVITYLSSQGQVIEQFIGNNVLQWDNDDLWKSITEKFKVLPFDSFIYSNGNPIMGSPGDLSKAILGFDERTSAFLYYYKEAYYVVGDFNYFSATGVVQENILYVSAQGMVFNSKGNTKVIKYGLPIIVDDLTTDDPTKVLSAAQGVNLRTLIEEGYKFFGVLSKHDVNFKEHRVKGYYLLIDGGEYPNVIVGGKPIKVSKWSLLIVDGENISVVRYPEFASQADVQTLKDTVEAMENVKTAVLTEEAYNTMVTNGSVESDRFYYTYEE